MASEANILVENEDGFFNDLTRPNPHTSKHSHNDDANMLDGNEGQPRAKRIACTICRKRKLRCDGARPKCASCARLNHECGYDEVRKKSGPKRGYVKALEERLAQVETLLKTQDKDTTHEGSPDITSNESTRQMPSEAPRTAALPMNETPYTTLPPPPKRVVADPWAEESWDLMPLGMEEPLPTQDAQNELFRIYFERVHPSCPMIHKLRFHAAINLAPMLRPPIALRYIMWCLAAALSDRYASLAPEFYKRARKYADADEMRGSGEQMLTIGHCQMWVLCAWYEFKHMYFPRAWVSTGHAVSLAVMLGLNRVDGGGFDVKQCLPPPKDWTEREERRRTFWTVFGADRYASIGTGWAQRLDERDIMTMLPASEEAYEKSMPQPTVSLEQAFSNAANSNISAISGVTMITCLLGRNLIHLHRPSPHDNEKDLNGLFWQRHRQLENLLSNVMLHLPDHLRVPAGLPDGNVIFLNMLLQTSVICLHQAAIFKADKNGLPTRIIEESREACMSSAREIARTMKMIIHLDLATINPFVSFCLYVASRVFVQFVKSSPGDGPIIQALQFLGSAMHVLSRKNPLTLSFIAQLEVELDGTGIDISFGHESASAKTSRAFDCITDTTQMRPQAEVPANMDAVKCSPLFEIRESQNHVPMDNSVFQSQGITLAQEAAAASIGMSGSNPGFTFSLNPSSTGSSGMHLPDRSVSRGFPGSTLDGMDYSRASPNSRERTGSSSKSGTGSTSAGSAFTPPSIHDESSPPFLSSTTGGGANISATSGASPITIASGISPPAYERHGSFPHHMQSHQHQPQQTRLTSSVGQHFDIAPGFGTHSMNHNIFDSSFVSGTSVPGGLTDLPSAWDDMSGIEVAGVGGVTGLTPGPWNEVQGISGWETFDDSTTR